MNHSIQCNIKRNCCRIFSPIFKCHQMCVGCECVGGKSDEANKQLKCLLYAITVKQHSKPTADVLWFNLFQITDLDKWSLPASRRKIEQEVSMTKMPVTFYTCSNFIRIATTRLSFFKHWQRINEIYFLFDNAILLIVNIWIWIRVFFPQKHFRLIIWQCLTLVTSFPFDRTTFDFWILEKL